MKLVIQIPCFNEVGQLAATLADLPRAIEGVDRIEWLVIDDGSTDGTAARARELGVHHVLRFPRNRGLARAFVAGLDEAVRLGADLVVNTDADNQYRGEDIPRILAPLLRGEADMVVGDRQTAGNAHYPPLKRRLLSLGSWVVRQASGTAVVDAASGFRALNREAALRIVVTSTFSYTMESLIHAGHLGLAVTSVPIATNPATRPSRLFRSLPEYLWSSGGTIVRVWVLQRPLAFFLRVGGALGLAGLLVGGRFVVAYLRGDGEGHVQSLILTAILLVLGFLVAMFGLLADLLHANRRMAEEALFRLRRIEAERR